MKVKIIMKLKFISEFLKYSPFLLFLIIFYLLSRLLNLTNIPIFTDEAIYLRWGQIALSDPRWRFISLIDGKQPLLIWLFFPALKVISDPLVAGRMVSVLVGLIGMIGLVGFIRSFNRSWRVSLIAGVLYLLIPFFLVYNRLALYDGLLTTIAIWSLWISYWFGKKQRLDLALLLGTVIGSGLLTKSSAQFFLILLPLTLLLVEWRKKKRKIQLIKWVGLSAVVFIQAEIYENILRLSEFRHIVVQKNLTFIYSFSEFFHNPFQSFWGNLWGLTNWLVTYLTIPVSLISLIGLIWMLRKNWREGIFFSSHFLVPFLALAFFGKVIYPRFILFMTVPLLVASALFVDRLFNRFVKVNILVTLGAVMILLAPALYFDYLLLTNPVEAPLPYADRQQLINDWPAGYGIKEAISFLDNQSIYGPIWVGLEGTFGLYPMALELYLGKNPNVTFKAYWPVSEIPQELINSAKVRPTYMLFKERQDIPESWPLNQIAQYQRGDGPTYLKFYKVVSKGG